MVNEIKYEKKPELSCNNTVFKITVKKSEIDILKNKIISLSKKNNSPVVFIENEVENMIELTAVVASLTPGIENELNNLLKEEINSVNKYNSGNVSEISEPVQIKFSGFSKGG
jgi:hypothetical protein